MKRHLRLVLLFLIAGITLDPTYAAGQSDRMDSLLSLLPRVDEKEKAGVLISLADLLFIDDPQASLEYSEQARELAIEHDDDKSLARSLELIGFAHFYLYDYHSAIGYLERSLQKYKDTGDKDKQVELVKNIGLCYLQLSEFKKAMEHLQLAAGSFRELDESEKLADTYINLGLVFYMVADYAGALEYYGKATEIYDETGKPEMLSRLYNRIGMTYYSLGIYDRAVDYVIRSIDLKEKDDLRGRAIGHNNLGAIYKDLGDLDKALEHYRMSLSCSGQRGDSLGMPHVLTNIGGIYAGRGEADSALHFYRMSVKLSEAAGDGIQTARTKHNMAQIYIDRGDLKAAESCFTDFLALSRNTSYREGEAHALIGLGDIASMREQPGKARKYYMQSLALADSIHLAQVRKTAHSSLSELAESTGDLRDALYHYRMYTRIKDSLFTADRTRTISEMQTKYETRQKQQENDLLKAENDLKDRRIKALYTVIGGFMILLAAIAAFIWQYRRISQARKLLAESEAARLQEKFDHQGRELASSALALSRNLTLINKLLEDLRYLTPMINEEGLPVLMNISRNIRRLDSDAVWKEFEMRFENVHAQFYKNLTMEYPSLTGNEMRLCAFLKLGMSTKEISAITFQSIRAIEAARLRLRKKMGVESGADLAAFLQKF